MKKIIPLTLITFFMVISFASQAQTKTGSDFFAGKWKVSIPGTPYGDLVRIYVLEKKIMGLLVLFRTPPARK